MKQALQELKERLAVMTDINLAGGVLGWDQSTMLPDLGAPQRGRQLGALGKLSHQMLTSNATGELISKLESWADQEPTSNFDAALVREARRIYQLEVNVPSAFRSQMTEHYSNMYTAWTSARPANDFKKVAPMLQQSIELSRQFATFFPKSQHPLDAMIQFTDMGETVASIRKLFTELRAELVPLVKKVSRAPTIDATCLEGHFPEKDQLAFCKTIAEALGYDFSRGRMDLSPHPFMTRLSGNDIRITTRANPKDISDCLFSVIHEVGHAIYELGIDPSLDGNILANGVSAGVHESQSRLWENRVGRSNEFWSYFYPKLQETFPHFKRFQQETFMKAINKVDPGLIRVDADELTYNLHVMIRFDLECQLMEGTLQVKDLPDAWNARYLSDLGVAVNDYKNGCMQDVHWYSAPFGGTFQGYTIGNILSAQFYSHAQKSIPNLEQDFKQGQFKKLKSWLNEHVHKVGAATTPKNLVRNACGEDMTIRYYMDYLNDKYSKLYMF